MPVIESATETLASLRDRAASLPWTWRALLFGAVFSVLWMEYTKPGLNQRVLRDGLIFGVGPLTLAALHDRNLGWQVDRRALRNTVLLAAFVLPFYVVGSSLPSIRQFYPIWGTSTAPGDFVPHAIKLFLVALAAETYYRGLLCVGVGERFGWKAALISPVVYALHHIRKPPIEFVLSGPTDVLFGLVDYDADSILPSTIAHGGGLILLDWLVLHPPLIPTGTVVRWLRWLPVPL